MQGKVVSRNPTKTGKLHLSIEVITKPATDKAPAETKTVNCVLEMPQIQMALLIGASVPTVGSTVLCEYNVNPSTGLVSDEWVTISL